MLIPNNNKILWYLYLKITANGPVVLLVFVTVCIFFRVAIFLSSYVTIEAYVLFKICEFFCSDYTLKVFEVSIVTHLYYLFLSYNSATMVALYCAWLILSVGASAHVDVLLQGGTLLPS